MHVEVPTWLKALAAVAIVAGAWQSWRDRPAPAPPGVLAPGDPVQRELAGGTPFARGGWTLEPRASYAIVARVLGREIYRVDRMAEVAPVDLALGWGPMSDGAVLAPLEIEQSARFYTLRWSDAPPLPAATLLAHSANVHTIPADDRVERRLKRLRVGQLVRLEGELVDGRRPDGAHFRSSLTREDTGAGACEVLYVRRVEVLEPAAG